MFDRRKEREGRNQQAGDPSVWKKEAGATPAWNLEHGEKKECKIDDTLLGDYKTEESATWQREKDPLEGKRDCPTLEEKGKSMIFIYSPQAINILLANGLRPLGFWQLGCLGHLVWWDQKCNFVLSPPTFGRLEGVDGYSGRERKRGASHPARKCRWCLDL